MKSKYGIKEGFLNGVATHQMTVLRNDGTYRHLRFRRPESYCMGFDVLTWPGYLAVTGDMGEYVFQRIEDMFEFFRQPELRINEQYWAEKCQAADRRGKIEEFAPDTFRAEVLAWIAERDEEEGAELLQEVEDCVFSRLDGGEYAAYAALHDVERDRNPVFQDFGEVRCREYTFHFQWILYAIVWAIHQFDAKPAATEQEGG